MTKEVLPMRVTLPHLPHRRSMLVSAGLVLALVALTLVATTAKPHQALAASPVTINAESGTYVSEASPGSNFCTSTSTHLRYGTNGTRERALHAFNVTGAVPAGNSITSATLKLWSQQTSSTTVNAYKWAQTGSSTNWPGFPGGCTVTWANGGGVAVGPIIGSKAGLTSGAYVSVPITNLSVIPTTGDVGFLFGTPSTTELLFNSSGGTNPPQLVLTYAPATTVATFATGSGQTSALGDTSHDRYVVINDDQLAHIAAIHAANPATKVLAYQEAGATNDDPNFGCNPPYPHGSAGADYCFMKANYPLTFVKTTSAGVNAPDAKYTDFPTYHTMDPSRADYRDQWQSQVIARVGPDGFDGVLADDTNTVGFGHGLPATLFHADGTSYASDT